MMKKQIVLLSVFLGPLLLKAQQIGMYSHFFYKPMIHNPAFTGSSGSTNVMVISRAQWTDFSGSPQLNMGSIDGSFMNEKAGLGLVVYSDRKGLTNRIGGDASYSYRLNFNESTSLRFGIALGIVDHAMDYSQALVETQNDPTLFAGTQRKVVFNGNAGLAFFWKELQFGFAVPQLLGNRVNYNDTSNVRGYYTQARHYMGSLKYKFFISKEKNISIAPLALVRFVGAAPLQYDVNLNFDYQDKFWLGATYKSGYAVGANVGFRLHKQLYVGYSYDFITGSIGKYAGTSHELMLNFKFGKREKEVVAEPVKAEVPAPVVLENSAYENRMDSLQQQLAESQEKLRQLSEKLEKQAQMQNQLQQQVPQQNNQGASIPEGNQNAEISQSNAQKRYDTGTLIVTSQTKEFKNNDNHAPEKGYYVVIGTYFYRDLAMAEAQRFVARGYKTTDWVYSGPKNYNYIFMFKLKTKEEALEKIKIAREAGVKDAWIAELVD